MTTFIDMVSRIAGELRRSNINDSIKRAINDAIEEAASERFYFNEMHESFDTVPGQEYYGDLGLVELDDVWFYQNGVIGGQKERIYIEGQYSANDRRIGNATGGQLDTIALYGGQFRLQPIPTSTVTVYVDGYGKLLPSPLVADADTNAWLNEGELYVRALAKRNVMRDVIRDYGEATIYEATAEDYKQKLVERTTLKASSDTVRSTQF